jgi:spore coat protein U-like protein
VSSRVLVFLLLLMPSAASALITCTFSSTPGMSFGPYNDSSAVATDSNTSIVVRCSRVLGTNNANVVLQVGPSATSGTIATREMASGANRMSYNLYRDGGRSQVWGQTPGVDTVSLNTGNIANGGSADVTFTIFGRIPALQNVNTGAYGDSVQLTVSP